ncbi:MAG TPA: tetratricopeptide repeat protein [Blastocatellia bacterium]
MGEQTKRFYEFGPFRIDCGEHLLWRGGELVPLPPKVFDTLVLLVENSGHVLGKDELMKAVWPDSFVEEVNLAHNVSILRKVLSQGAPEQSYIQTVPRRGYRFTAEVRQIGGDRPDLLIEESYGARILIKEEEETSETAETKILPQTDHRESAKRRPIQQILIVCLLLMGLASAAFFVLRTKETQQSAGATVKSIAVLPFKPMETGNRDESLELGMADALITRLSNVKPIVVRPTSSVRKYMGIEQDSLTAGRELQVDSVLEGRIQKADDKIRVTVQLVRVQDGTPIWGDKFEDDFTNVFKVQDSISERIAKSLMITTSDYEKGLMTRHPTENTEAYQQYLKGRYYWNQRTEAGLKKAVGYFDQAINTDPTYALAYSGLADCYTTLGYLNYLAPVESFPKAVDKALTALKLDPSLAEPHTSLAYTKLYYEWNWAEAEDEFKRAIELDPNYPTAHHWYSVFLTAMGRFDEARAEISRAHELDPLSLTINTDIGFELYYSGDYEAAIKQLQTTLEMNRDFPLAHLWLGRAYQQQGKYEAAINEFKLAERGLPQWPVALAAAGNVYGILKNKGEAKKVLNILQDLSSKKYVTSYGIALVYAATGEKEKAFEFLNRAYQERTNWVVWLKLDPRWNSIRSDTRFADLLLRVGLSQ